MTLFKLVPLRSLPGGHWIQNHDKPKVPVDQTITVGRSEGCILKIKSPQASRNHATITPSEDGLVIKDQGSRNGTFVASNCTANAFNARQLIQGSKLLHEGKVVIFAGVPFLIIKEKEKIAPVAKTPEAINQRPIYKLTLQSGDNEKAIFIYKGQTLNLNQSVIEQTLGLNDPNIHKTEHCSIEQQDDQLILTTNTEDAEYRTYVNSRRMQVAFLREGDSISLGSVELKLEKC